MSFFYSNKYKILPKNKLNIYKIYFKITMNFNRNKKMSTFFEIFFLENLSTKMLWYKLYRDILLIECYNSVGTSEDEVTMKLADLIKKLREDNNMTQDELAKICIVSRESISKWEGGSRRPTIENLSVIAKYFNYPLKELIDMLVAETLKEDIIQVSEISTRKKKVTFVVPLFNLILTALVCIALIPAAIYINKSINQEKRYNGDIIYVEEIETINIIFKNKPKEIYQVMNKCEENCNHNLAYIHYYLNNVYIDYYKVDIVSNCFIDIRIKYIYSTRFYGVNYEIAREYSNNELEIDYKYGLFLSKGGNYDFILYIYDNTCYIGAFLKEVGE